MALALALVCGQVHATSFLFVQRDASHAFGARAIQNAAALKARASQPGESRTANVVRVEIVLDMAPSVAALDISTGAGLQARIQAVAAQVQNFRTANHEYFPGVFQVAAITPYIDAEVTPVGVDALMLQPTVYSLSESLNYKEALRDTNGLLSTALLPSVPNGELGGSLIAIIDSGVATSHPSFKVPSTKQSRVLLGGCSSSSLNGLPTICNAIAGGPCASISDDQSVQDALLQCGHGTHVAGIAAAANQPISLPGNVPASTSGMLPSAGILSFQASSLRIDPETSRPARAYRNFDIKRGLEFAFLNRNHGGKTLRAVNMSFGLQRFTDTENPFPTADECNGSVYDLPNNPAAAAVLAPIRQVRQAIVDLRNVGVSVVAAAGNEGVGMGFPACALDLSITNPQRTVISVGATRKNDAQTNYSQMGFSTAFAATLLAPGGDLTGEVESSSCALGGTTGGICSTSSALTFQRRSGTSMAAPHVTGLIARLAERFPTASSAQIESLMTNSGVPLLMRGLAPGSPAQIFNVTIPRVAPFAAFRNASLPQDITTNTQTCGQIALNWNAPSIMQANNYRVRSASTLAGLQSAPSSLTSAATSFTLLNIAQLQFFEVAAIDAQGEGAWSAPVSATPNPCGPAAVANFRIADGETLPTPATGCFFGLRWNASAAPITQYKVQEICSGGAPSQIVLVDASRNYFRTQPGMATPCDVAQNLPNTYQIQACEGTNCGPWSPSLTHGRSTAKCGWDD